MQDDGVARAAKRAAWCHELCLANRAQIGALEDVRVLEPAHGEPQPETPDAKKRRLVAVKSSTKEKRESDGEDDALALLFGDDDGLMLFDEDELPSGTIKSAADGTAVDADRDDDEAVKENVEVEQEEEDADLNVEDADSYNRGSEDSKSESVAAEDW